MSPVSSAKRPAGVGTVRHGPDRNRDLLGSRVRDVDRRGGWPGHAPRAGSISATLARRFGEPGVNRTTSSRTPAHARPLPEARRSDDALGPATCAAVRDPDANERAQGACRPQALAATRRKSTSLMVTPGAAQLLAGGPDRRACSSVSNTRNEKTSPSSGSSQKPATKPGAERIVGRRSCVSALAAADAWSASIVNVTSAA